MTKTSGTFTDLESSTQAYWAVRPFPEVVTLFISLESSSDVEVSLDVKTAREIATALLVALSDVE